MSAPAPATVSIAAGDHPPHDPEAERAVLGAAILNSDALLRVIEKLRVDDFYLESHRIVYQSCLDLHELHEKGEGLDLVTVRNHLEKRGLLEQAGGLLNVSSLIDATPDTANVIHYAAIVIQHSVARDVAEIGRRLTDGCDVEAVLPDLMALAGRDRGAGLRLTMRRLDGFLALDLPPPEPVMSPVIYTDEIVQFVAFRGTGKTFLGLILAAAIAAGVEPFPGWSVLKPRPAIFCDGELPHARIQERLRAVCAGLRIDASVPVYTICKTDPENRGRFRSLSTPEGRADIDACVETVFREHGVMPVLFLDSLSTLLDAADENSREFFAPVGEWMAALRGRGVVVIFFHHTGWDQSHGRGTSAREDLIDTSIRLRAPGGRPSFDGAMFEIIFDKSRNLGPGEAKGFELRLESAPHGGVIFSRTEVGERAEGDVRAAISDCVELAPGCSMNHVCESVDGRRQDIIKTTKLMIAGDELRNEGKGMSYKLFRSGSRPTDPGTSTGTTLPTRTGSGENTGGNKAEQLGNHLGTGTGIGTGSPVPTLTGGGGNRLGNTTMCKLPVADAETWPTEPRNRLLELECSGMKRAAAIAKVRAEHGGER